MRHIESLREKWLREAQFFRANAVEQTATVIERLAGELDGALRSEVDEELSVEQAAHESGYSTSHIRHLLMDGKLPNVGELHRPRIRRGDLPKKPKRSSGAFDPVAAADRTLARRIG